MTNRTGFYITRAFIGMFEGGFIPGAILMATYFILRASCLFALPPSGPLLTLRVSFRK